MPELPEVETTRRGLLPLLHQSVRHITVHQSRLRQEVPNNLVECLNQPIDALTRRGKYLLFHTPKGTIMVHLGMSGSLRLVTPDLPLRKHDHVVLSLSGGLELRYHDPRRFGLVLWLTEAPEQHPLLASLGPEPLSTEFSPDYLYQSTRSRRSPIKSVIMDSHVVVGVGNIYAAEALFYAGINPLTPANLLSLLDCQRLYVTIKHILAQAIERGGTTLRDFVNSQGETGYFQQELMVYGREGDHCRVCGHRLELHRLNNRSTVYCPQCQPLILASGQYSV